MGPRNRGAETRRRDRDAESAEDGRVWGGGHLSSRLEGLGKRRKLPQRGPGHSPCPKTGIGAWDFLLLRNSNLGPILHRFRDFADFMCS